jgi:hypothetical protein
MKVVLFSAIVLFSLSTVTAAELAELLPGKWENEARTHSFEFRKSGDLTLTGHKVVMSARTKKYERISATSEGAWESREELCWKGDDKLQAGNLVVYSGSMQCCISAQFVGSKLILGEVWRKGSNELGVCANHVLTRAK